MQVYFLIDCANTGNFTYQPVCPLGEFVRRRTRRHRGFQVFHYCSGKRRTDRRSKLSWRARFEYSDKEKTTQPATPRATPPTTPGKRVITDLSFMIIQQIQYVLTGGSHRNKGDPNMMTSKNIFNPTWFVFLVPLATSGRSSVIVSLWMYSSIVRVVHGI